MMNHEKLLAKDLDLRDALKILNVGIVIIWCMVMGTPIIVLPVYGVGTLISLLGIGKRLAVV
jgi:hypothetical protein